MDVKPELHAKVQSLMERSQGTLGSLLGIEFQVLDTEKVVAKMAVLPQLKQPFGQLHGGASVALAESLASVGAWLNVDETKYSVVGMEINANHLRPMFDGFVIGTAVPLHRGRKTQVWDIKIHSEDDKLVCLSRCTIAVTPV